MMTTTDHFTEVVSTGPFSEEAEAATLGSVLSYPACFEIVANLVGRDDFFLLRNRYVWETFERLHKDHLAIEFVAIRDDLEKRGKLQEIGGAAYLTLLINRTPSSQYADVYAQLVKRSATRRRLLELGDAIKSLAVDMERPVEEIQVEVDRMTMSAQRGVSPRMVSLHAAISAHYDRTEQAMQNPNEIIGIPSPFRGLNEITRGWRRGKLYVFAGRPGMGKSSFLMTEAMYMAKMGIPVALFTQEVAIEEYTDNIIASYTGVPADVIATGKMDANQYSRYVKATGDLSKWPLTIDDTSGLTPSQLRLRCRQLRHERGLRAVFVDYIQLMSGGNEVKYGNRDQEIGYISRSLKELSKELEVPVIAAAQLSRSVEQREDKRPQLSDLRESGNIENDADFVAFMYREDYYLRPATPPIISPTEIAIAKHRGGRTGTFTVGFRGELKTFVELHKAA